MATPIVGLGSLPPIQAPAAPAPARESSFGDVLAQSVARVEGLRADAGAAVGRLLSGEGEELHTAALAAQKAELAFEMFLQVRNKVVQAYQEVMRMQI